MKVAVVGMGLFGRSMAVNLARAGAEVIAIDANIKLIDDVKEDVDVAVMLDATDERELRAQGIHQVDLLVAAIGDDFETNQLVVILAKKLGIPKVVARAPSPVHARILGLIGADEVYMPEEQAAASVAQRLGQPSLKAYFQLVEGYSVAEIEAPPSFQGRDLASLDLKKRFRIQLIAITRTDPEREGKHRINAVPMGTDVIERGDILAVAGKDEDIRVLLSRPPA